MTPVDDFDPDAIEPGYVYMQLADDIAARINAGELRPGARLPGERDLCIEYGVSLGTVRRATVELRARALVATLPGRGTYIITRRTA
jgi:DNA-binding GntR family transcriptional regulator